MSYTAADYLTLSGSDEIWIWKGLLPVSGSMLLYSNPKVGKSFMALGLSAAIADPTVDSYMGQPILQHGKTLYIQLDTPRRIWQSVYVSKIASVSALGSIYIVDREMDDIPQPFDIRQLGCHDWLKREIDAVEPVAVVVDTIRRVHQGDENDNTVMQVMHDTFVEIAKPAALTYLAHRRKPGNMGDDQADSVSQMRGASSLSASVDALIHMTKKRLTITARSDAPEEIAIFQQENGYFAVNDREEEIGKFLASLSPELGAREKDHAVGEQFGVGERTARKWRKDWEGGR